MVKISNERLKFLALAALEDVVRDARIKKPERTHAVRLCLAYLASQSGPERWPYDEFWEYMDDDTLHCREANLTRLLNAIYIRVNVMRTIEMMA